MKRETLQAFYKHKFDMAPEEQPGSGHFNVFRLKDCMKQGTPIYSRKDFYKVVLIRGTNRYHYADKSLEMSGPNLMFLNPQVPYTWEPISGEVTGYFCIFTTDYVTAKMRGNINDLPMFATGGKPSYPLNDAQDAAVSALFEKMLDEMASDYTFKYDLIFSYLNELIHMALKTQPAESLYEHPNANSRITAVFNELLERQFPIETPVQRFTMRSASDYANTLAMHVNHLNRAVRTTTGKTTSTLISERIAAEAKALLKHTDWNISEISNSLGFEEPSHFNNFFRKLTSLTPSKFRSV
jgi:AraC family transcriptional regulator, transcriptional activator of pobA